MSEDDTEKEHEPSQKKLDDARQRGELVRSAEITTAAGYGGLFLAALGFGATGLQALGTVAQGMLDQPEETARLLLGGGAATLGGLGIRVIGPVLPFLVVPGLAVLVAILAQRALVFAPEKLAPRLSRIDPLANLKNKFGRAALFEFAKSTAKLVLVSLMLGGFAALRLPHILQTQNLGTGAATIGLMQLMQEFLLLLFTMSAALGVLDYLWQHFEHLRRNRMSRQELMDEYKQSEGDPKFKQQRRQKAQAIAMNRMLADVPKADVVIVNPTHYAVALRWNRGSRRAPVCVAKGVDEVAARIRNAAATAGVPIHPDPATARSLYASVEVGREIRAEHYAPVAAAIRFAERMRLRARGGWKS